MSEYKELLKRVYDDLLLRADRDGVVDLSNSLFQELKDRVDPEEVILEVGRWYPFISKLGAHLIGTYNGTGLQAMGVYSHTECKWVGKALEVEFNDGVET